RPVLPRHERRRAVRHRGAAGDRRGRSAARRRRRGLHPRRPRAAAPRQPGGAVSGAPIAVIGAGAAGLLAALELATRGVAVDLYALGSARRGAVASAGRWLAAAPLDSP